MHFDHGESGSLDPNQSKSQGSCGPAIAFPGCALFKDVIYLEDRSQLRTPVGCGPLSVAWWSYIFLMLLLVPACHGLISIAVKLLSDVLTVPQYIYLGLSVVGLLLFEGYLGFHRSWSPATARRALILPYGHPNCLLVLCAPLFAAGFFYAPPKRLAVAYLLPPFVIGLIFLVRLLESPAHEIVDAGVAVGLTTGTLSFSYHFLRALWTNVLPEDVDYKRSNKKSLMQVVPSSPENNV